MTSHPGLSAPVRSTLLQLVDLIVKGLEADTQLLGGGGLVAVVLLEDDLDVLHLDVAQGGISLGDLEVRPADRRGRRRGAAGGDLGRQVFRADRAAAGE